MEKGAGNQWKTGGEKDVHHCTKSAYIFFSLFLKDSVHKSQEVQSYGSLNSHNSAPCTYIARHKYHPYPVTHGTCVQRDDLWLLWEPSL